jgi:hypothetical protein
MTESTTAIYKSVPCPAMEGKTSPYSIRENLNLAAGLAEAGPEPADKADALSAAEANALSATPAATQIESASKPDAAVPHLQVEPRPR